MATSSTSQPPRVGFPPFLPGLAQQRWFSEPNISFPSPLVHAAVQANTFAIYGNGEDKELTELVPGILNQLGPDSLASLRKLAESYQLQKKDEDDEDIPDLVEGENFESKVE